MKVCPRCQSRYDDASRFCRKDGAELLPDRAVAPEVLARRDLLERRLGQEPEDVELLTELGDLLSEIPLYDEALVQYFKVLELRPGLGPVRRKVAELYRARGEWAEAARHLEPLSEASPADLELLGELADVYVHGGRRSDAAALLARMAELAPADAALWRRRRDLLQELRRDDELLGVQRRLTELDPGDLANWFPVARHLLIDGAAAPTEDVARVERRFAKAQAAGEAGTGQRASHLVLYLAALRLKLGTAGPGLRDLLREVDGPGLDGAHNRLAADSLAQLGDLAAGAGDAEQALDCYGAALRFADSPRARQGLAGLHRARAERLLSSKRYREAVAVCDAGLAAAGEDPGLRALRQRAAGRRTRRLLVGVGLGAAALLAALLAFLYTQGGGPFGEAPTVEDLRTSFAGHLQEQGVVKGLRRAEGGREITFTVGEDRWRVVVVDAAVAPSSDDTGFRGVLQTRWEKNGTAVSSRRALPPELVKAGLGPRANDARYSRSRRQWKW